MKYKDHIFPLLHKERKFFLFATIFSFIWGAFCMINQYVLGYAIDDIFYNYKARGLMHVDNVLTLSTLLLNAIITWMSTYLSFIFSGKFATNSTEHLRNEVFDVLQQQSNKFYDNNSTGDLLTKSTGDIDELVQFMQTMGIYTGIILGELIFCLFLLVKISPVLAIICVGSVPLNWLVSNYFRKKLIPESLKSRELVSKQTKFIQENIEGAKICRVFDAQSKKLHEFTNINKSYRNIMQKVEKLQAGGSPFVYLITGATEIVLLIMGGKMVIDNQITIGGLITVLMLSRWMFAPINNAAWIIIRYGRVKPSILRVSDLILSIPEIRNPTNPHPIDNTLRGTIEFDNVSFGYQNEDILRNISINIPEFSTVAILGATGSGKSSLINLIPRYYDSNAGNIKIGGVDVKRFELESLRKHIGFVDQDTFLFSKTIRDNIAFGKPEAKQEEIEEVAQIACIHDYILTLPDQYDTIVGERGITLSGGQRQRISIARTLLAEPLIVVFDDSLSAVDVATEKEIRTALNRFIKNQTTIIVTQRLSMTAQVDTCLILKDGEIIEQGNHADLLQLNGTYAKLYASQIDGIMDLSMLEGSA